MMMTISSGSLVPFLLTASAMAAVSESRRSFQEIVSQSGADASTGTQWAILVAGSNGYDNYRHQADVCHAYQILKANGLKDENIIVFMYDDIAENKHNPTKGIIINKPNGPDVYHGVPKDYTGDETTAANLYAVLIGNKAALSGGSGKVLNSGPNDHVFFYYSDHGATGVMSMPAGDYIYANDFMNVLRQMYKAKKYNNMVIYIEACEAGSILQGLLPEDLGIYATTASNAEENSWAYYCPSGPPGRGPIGGDPAKYGTCLGISTASLGWRTGAKAPKGSAESVEAQKRLDEEIARRSHADRSINQIINQLFGDSNAASMLTAVRPEDQPVVDDWDCLKTFVRAYEQYCGRLSEYGRQYTRAMANMCNAGVSKDRMEAASIQACSGKA